MPGHTHVGELDGGTDDVPEHPLLETLIVYILHLYSSRARLSLSPNVCTELVLHSDSAESALVLRQLE